MSEQLYKEPGVLEIMKGCCKQCLFSPAKIVSEEQKRSLLAECQRAGKHFVCHKASQAGRDVMCHGFYLTYPAHTPAMRLAKFLGLEQFISLGPARLLGPAIIAPVTPHS